MRPVVIGLAQCDEVGLVHGEARMLGGVEAMVNVGSLQRHA
jgi:hypothetical protein